MDAETLRLLITGTAGVIAGLIGALVAGSFNQKNTSAINAASKATAEAQRMHDVELAHAQWLRDRKVQAYGDFIEKARNLAFVINEFASETLRTEMTGSNLVARTRELAQDQRFRLYSSSKVREAASMVVNHALPLVIKELPTSEKSDLNKDRFREAAKILGLAIDVLEDRVRLDLGIDDNAEVAALSAPEDQ